MESLEALASLRKARRIARGAHIAYKRAKADYDASWCLVDAPGRPGGPARMPGMLEGMIFARAQENLTAALQKLQLAQLEYDCIMDELIEGGAADAGASDPEGR